MNKPAVCIVGTTLIHIGSCFAQIPTSHTEVGSNYFLRAMSGTQESSLVAAKCDRAEQKCLSRKVGVNTKVRDNDGCVVRTAEQNSDKKDSQITAKDLIVALIGFVAAIIGGLIQSLFSMWKTCKAIRENIRMSYRDKISDLADKIGEAMYELLSGCDICLKKWEKHGSEPYKQKDQEDAFQNSIRKWQSKADDAANKLKELRAQARYKLYGIDEALRTLTRVNNWITHYKVDIKAGRAFLNRADELRKAIDNVMMEVMDSGDRPTKGMVRTVTVAANAVRKQHEKTNPRCEGNEY